MEVKHFVLDDTTFHGKAFVLFNFHERSELTSFLTSNPLVQLISICLPLLRIA